jgi:large subunit ribosomal protein L9
MQVILREDVPELGIIGDVVEVKPGYARNYLIPRGMAVPADRRNLRQLEHDKRIIEVKKQRERGTYERLASQLGALKLETEVRAGRRGRLFGSVTNIDVHQLLADKGIEIDRRRIELREPIKEIGEFKVTIRVGQDISTLVSLTVKPLGGELEDLSVDGEPESVAEPAPEAAQPEAVDDSDKD